WLARADLNRYDAAANRVAISPIFKWFKSDFSGDGELSHVLANYGPEKFRPLFQRGDFSIDYLDYNWGLNDQGGHGADYHPSLFKRLF
ncbi:MAG: hypothetical protein KGJ37_02490, partial [Verrucomicrobiota bacterium]|nr:hypothetical protein [Verrucomicrobiota bacterium]